LALAERFGLGTAEAQRMERLLVALLEDPAAPTAIRQRRKALDDHVADSLVALDLVEVRRARVAIDIGSGAGLPALPLAIALPQCRFTLLESTGRKCAFLERTVEACQLANVAVLQARAEEAPALGLRDTAELVTVRAVAELGVVAEYAAPLLRIGGVLLAWRGRRDPGAEVEAETAGRELGLESGRVIQVWPYPTARDRYLHLMSKVSITPERFPRRPGVALKRPLGRATGA
jgi:16S rRNA (guanine527-N7)-methyltransferase